MNRLWLILATLTLARMTMGFQFQSVAAAGPALTSDLVISYTELGALIGIYLLPAQVLQRENRAIGMGVFYTIYYVGMGIFPAIAGYTREVTGNPAAPLVLAATAILFAILALAGFRILQRRNSGGRIPVK